MRRSQPPAIISMEELVEENVISKVGVTIEFLVPTVRRTPAVHVASKDVNETMLDLFSDLGEVHVVAAASRALDLEVAAVVLVEALKGLDEQEVDGELVPR